MPALTAENTTVSKSLPNGVMFNAYHDSIGEKLAALRERNRKAGE